MNVTSTAWRSGGGEILADVANKAGDQVGDAVFELLSANGVPVERADKRRPSVEYIPQPYRPSGRRAGRSVQRG